MYNYIQRQVVCVMGELGLLTTGNFSIGMCFGESYRKQFCNNCMQCRLLTMDLPVAVSPWISLSLI